MAERHMAVVREDLPAQTAPQAIGIAGRSDPIQYALEFEAAKRIGDYIYKSGLAPAGVRNGEAAAIIILTGYELGFSWMQALRQIYVIGNKPVLAADAMAGIIKRFCRQEGGGYIRVLDQEWTTTHCTVEFMRHDDTDSQRVTFTIEEAKLAELVKPGSNWIKYPKDMLKARALSRACRTGWPDVLGGVYDPDELNNATEAQYTVRPAVARAMGTAEAEMLANGDEIIEAAVPETSTNTRTAPRTAPPAAPAATVSAPPAPPVAPDAPMTEDTRRALYAAGKDKLGWGADEVYALISATYDVADVWQLTDKQARALTLLFNNDPERARAKLAEIQGAKSDNSDLILELEKTAATKGISEDQLLLIAWRKFGVQSYGACTEEQLEQLDQVLQLDESKLADVVLDAEETAKQAQAKK